MNGGNGYAPPFANLDSVSTARAGEPSSTAAAASSGAPADGAAATDDAAADGSELVSCPSCGCSIRLADAYAHLDVCPGPEEGGAAEPGVGRGGGAAGSSSDGAGGTGPSGADGAADELVQCPICRRRVLLSEMNSHLDECCEASPGKEAAVAPPTESPTAATTQQLAPRHIDRLAEELRCARDLLPLDTY